MSRVAGIAISLPVFVFVAPAQVEQAAITGAVTDQSDALVAGAKVTVTNVRTGVKSTTLTNADGYGAPNGSVTSPDFGRITSASGTRTIQMGIRLSY